MAIGQAINTSLRYIVEATFGAAPTGSGYREIRHITESLESTTGRAKSSEMRTDRKIIASRRTGVGAAGDISGELAPDLANEDFIRAALHSAAWPTVKTPQTNFAVTDDHTVNKSSLHDHANAGDFVLLHGFTTAATLGNNRVMKVESAGSSNVNFYGSGLTAVGADAAFTYVQGDKIADGSSLRTFSIERAHSDLANEFAVFRGMAVDSMSVGMSEGDFVSLNFSFTGADEMSPRPTAKQSSGTPTAACKDPSFSSPDDIGALVENNLDIDLVSFDFTYNNGLYESRKANKLGAQAIGSGNSDISGSFTMLFEDSTQLDKYLADTSTSIAFWVANGKWSYVFEFPQCRFSKGATSRGSGAAPITAEFEFDVEMEEASPNDMIRVWRFYAPTTT